MEHMHETDVSKEHTNSRQDDPTKARNQTHEVTVLTNESPSLILVTSGFFPFVFCPNV